MSKSRSGLAAPAVLVGSLTGRRHRGKSLSRRGKSLSSRVKERLPGAGGGHRRGGWAAVWGGRRHRRGGLASALGGRRRWPWRRRSRAQRAMELARKAGAVVSAATFVADLVSEVRKAGGDHGGGESAGGGSGGSRAGRSGESAGGGSGESAGGSGDSGESAGGGSEASAGGGSGESAGGSESGDS